MNEKSAKIIIMIITTLFLTSTFVSADRTFSEKNITSFMGHYHNVHCNYNGWEKTDTFDMNYSDGNQGDPSVNEYGGSCSVNCVVDYNGEKWEKNGFSGKTFFTAPITANNVTMTYNYNVSINIEYKTWAVGDWVKGHVKAFVSLFEDDDVIYNKTFIPRGGDVNGTWNEKGATHEGEFSDDNYEFIDGLEVDLDKNSEYYFLFEAEVFSAIGIGIGKGKSNASLELNLSCNPLGITFEWANRPPSKPSTPSGPIRPHYDRAYTYTTSSTDPDGDKIKYEWCFGGQAEYEMIGPFDSGEEASIEKKWYNKGEYFVKVRAIDYYNGFEQDHSEWSEIAVNVPRPVGRNPNLLHFFQSFNPILKQILQNQIFLKMFCN